jgi:hypothetical protein
MAHSSNCESGIAEDSVLSRELRQESRPKLVRIIAAEEVPREIHPFIEIKLLEFILKF